ncbi:RibD family protein [Hyphomonadaceae bacterium BL14]|nr:RibD family protein [Hyphomonadaceae bacterium BL14]
MSAPVRVTLKLATSLDARIALASGQSKWITGPEARAAVHQLRAGHDAVLTGVGTVLADNPQMTARPGGALSGHQPIRAVLDTWLRTPPDCALLTQGPAVLFHGSGAPVAAREALEAAGARCVARRSDQTGISIDHVIEWLASESLGSVLIEAGGRVAASAIRAGIVDRIEWFRAPVLLGGDALPAIAALGLETLDGAPMFRRTHLRECGADTWETWECD